MLEKNKIYTIFLVISLLSFLIKGIQYAVLGSYVPILLSLFALTLLYFNRTKKKTLNILVKVWALLVIIWSILRLLISILDKYGKELMENHLQENLGTIGLIISVTFLYIGIFLFRKKNRINWMNR